MMSPISIISEFERHLLSAFKHPLPTSAVCVKKYFFFPEQKSFLDLEWEPEFYSYAIVVSLAGHSMKILCNGIFCPILQPFVASLARDAPHVPLVWLILSCPVILLGGVMMMLFGHWKILDNHVDVHVLQNQIGF